MATLLSIGQTLKGRISTYSVSKELHQAADNGAVYLSLFHGRLQNEAAVLKRYQADSPLFRPVIDTIEEPTDPPTILLEYRDSDLLAESDRKRLSRPEIKDVAKSVLEALCILHKDGMVHSDFGRSDRRFSKVQLGDFGSVVSQDSKFAKEGHLIGASFTRSPEAQLQLPWGTPTDIWSFGNAILSLLYGGGFHLFNPANEKIKTDNDEYELTVLYRMHRYFGPFPTTFQEITDDNAATIINHINDLGPPGKPYHLVTRREIPPADRDFIIKIMKLDPRDRPTAEQLLADSWFTEESEDTRDPL
nr:serine/threonine-protein kinase pak mbt [Quercus suber]